MTRLKTTLLVFALILFFNAFATAQKKNNKNIKRKTVAAKVVKPKIDAPASEKVKAAAFELEDQFGKKLAIKFPSEKITVLVFGDRGGAEQIEGWVRPLYGKYTDKIEIHGIAELSAVPWIAKGVVRGTIKSRSKTPVMLDWSGKVSKDYGSQGEKANLFVVSKDGYILAEKRGAATAAELADLHKVIDGVLE